MGKPDGRRQVRRSRHRTEDNIKMVLRERRWCGKGLNSVAQIRTSGGMVTNILVP
jgi:hypothetical protein